MIGGFFLILGIKVLGLVLSGFVDLLSMASDALGVIPIDFKVIIPLVYKPKVILPKKLTIDSGRNSGN